MAERKRSITFADAKRRYVHRFTMEHVPRWALAPVRPGQFYAPQYASDREWYDRATFPGEPGYYGNGAECMTSDQTWPLGQWLPEVYRRQLSGRG